MRVFVARRHLFAASVEQIFSPSLTNARFVCIMGEETKKEHLRLFPIEQPFAFVGCRADRGIGSTPYSLPCVKGGGTRHSATGDGGIVTLSGFAKTIPQSRIRSTAPFTQGSLS